MSSEYPENRVDKPITSFLDTASSVGISLMTAATCSSRFNILFESD